MWLCVFYSLWIQPSCKRAMQWVFYLMYETYIFNFSNVNIKFLKKVITSVAYIILCTFFSIYRFFLCMKNVKIYIKSTCPPFCCIKMYRSIRFHILKFQIYCFCALEKYESILFDHGKCIWIIFFHEKRFEIYIY